MELAATIAAPHPHVRAKNRPGGVSFPPLTRLVSSQVAHRAVLGCFFPACRAQPQCMVHKLHRQQRDTRMHDPVSTRLTRLFGITLTTRADSTCMRPNKIHQSKFTVTVQFSYPEEKARGKNQGAREPPQLFNRLWNFPHDPQCTRSNKDQRSDYVERDGLVVAGSRAGKERKNGR